MAARAGVSSTKREKNSLRRGKIKKGGGELFVEFLEKCKAGIRQPRSYEIQTTNGRVDIEHATLLLACLKEAVHASVSTEFLDNIMGHLQDITGEAATAESIRALLGRLRQWEVIMLKGAVAADDDDRARIRMYVATVAQALLSALFEQHSLSVSGTSKVTAVQANGTTLSLTGSQLGLLSWEFAIAESYTFARIVIFGHGPKRRVAGGYERRLYFRIFIDRVQHHVLLQQLLDQALRVLVRRDAGEIAGENAAPHHEDDLSSIRRGTTGTTGGHSQGSAG